MVRVRSRSPVAGATFSPPSISDPQQLLEAVLDATATLVIVLDREGRVVRFNRV
jgi:hypothetical protein